MSKTVPQFAEGELINVSIRGARVSEVTHALDGATVVDLVTSHVLRLPLTMRGVTIERVAPAEWPPETGDIWADANGDEWVTTASDGETILMRGIEVDGDALDSLDVLYSYGPMRLVRRRGWTPAADTTPAAPEPEQVDERAAYVAGLRRIADLVEVRADFPVPYSHAGQVEFQTREELERAVAEFDLKLRVADGHDAAELHIGGTYLNLCWFKPNPVAEPLPHRQPADTRLSLDEALADAFPGPEATGSPALDCDDACEEERVAAGTCRHTDGW